MILVATSNLGGNIWDASLRVVDLSTKKLVASVQQHNGCADACWAALGQRAICAEDSGDVKVYRLDQDAPARLVEVATLQEHDDIVSCVAASRSQDGLVLSGSYDRSINAWDIAGNREVNLDTFTGHSNHVTGVKWAAGEDDNQIFASSSLDCSMRIWDRRQTKGCCACHWLGVSALSLAWEPRAQVLVAVGCEDGTVALLDRRALSTPVSIQRVHTGRVNRISFRPEAVDGGQGQTSPLLASVGDDGVLAVQALAGGSYHSRLDHAKTCQAVEEGPC
eukprot:jgi/Undpi1/662/HiC_scaffold_10.g04126.m1